MPSGRFLEVIRERQFRTFAEGRAAGLRRAGLVETGFGRQRALFELAALERLDLRQRQVEIPPPRERTLPVGLVGGEQVVVRQKAGPDEGRDFLGPVAARNQIHGGVIRAEDVIGQVGPVGNRADVPHVEARAATFDQIAPNAVAVRRARTDPDALCAVGNVVLPNQVVTAVGLPGAGAAGTFAGDRDAVHLVVDPAARHDEFTHGALGADAQASVEDLAAVDEVGTPVAAVDRRHGVRVRSVVPSVEGIVHPAVAERGI